jgi:hypothetical protein
MEMMEIIHALIDHACKWAMVAKHSPVYGPAYGYGYGYGHGRVLYPYAYTYRRGDRPTRYYKRAPRSKRLI